MKEVYEITTQEYTMMKNLCSYCGFMGIDGFCKLKWCANIKFIERHTTEICLMTDERFIELGSLF